MDIIDITKFTDSELSQYRNKLQAMLDARNARLKKHAQDNPEKYEKKFKKHPPENNEFTKVLDEINSEISKRSQQQVNK